MYNNNYLCKLDCHGRLVIPKNIREVFDLENCQVEVFSENDLIILRKCPAEAPSAPNDVQQFKRTKGTSMCNHCICQSCTGFGCPWIPKTYRYGYSLTNNRITERCLKCMTQKLKMIYDCDFYTCRKRKKFYVKHRYIRNGPSKHEIVMRELRELKKMIHVK